MSKRTFLQIQLDTCFHLKKSKLEHELKKISEKENGAEQETHCVERFECLILKTDAMF